MIEKLDNCNVFGLSLNILLFGSVYYNRRRVIYQAHLEFVFQEQSYSSLHSGWSLAWDHFRGDINDPCGVIAYLKPKLS